MPPTVGAAWGPEYLEDALCDARSCPSVALDFGCVPALSVPCHAPEVSLVSQDFIELLLLDFIRLAVANGE